MDRCIICQAENKDAFVERPSAELYETLLKRTRERARYKDSKVIDFVERKTALNPLETLNSNNRYHISCYSDFADTLKLKRAQKRYNDSVAQENSTLIIAKFGRPSTTTSKIELAKNQLNCRCQKLGGTLHLVPTKNARNLMQKVSEKHAYKSFYHRLHTMLCSARDVIANDA